MSNDAYAQHIPAVMALITARWVSQSLHAAAKLNLYDSIPLLPDRISAVDLAAKSSLQPAFVYRLLRLLATNTETLVLHQDRTFSLTRAGELLTDACPISMKGMLLLEESVKHRRAWEFLEHVVRNGNADATGFELAHGSPVFVEIGKDHEYAAVFNKAMSSYTASNDAVVAATADFSSSSVVADIGGNHGTLLTHILRKNPHLTGYTLDIAPVISSATVTSDLTTRHRLITGDFFTGEGVEPADTYIMKHVLHDWDDTACTNILGMLHRVAPADARILNFDLVVPEPGQADNGSMGLDIHMMVAATGKEREDVEWRQLFSEAGWRIVRIAASAGSALSCIEAVKQEVKA